MGLITRNAPARHVVSAADRMSKVAAAIKKLGAATVVDLAKETGFNRETCRRYLNMLVERGAAELIAAGTTHVGAIYGPTETSSDVEFDVSRVTTANWPRGQGWRDPLVAALFGAPARGAHL